MASAQYYNQGCRVSIFICQIREIPPYFKWFPKRKYCLACTSDTFLTFVVVLAEKNVVWHCLKTRLFELAFRPFADCLAFIIYFTICKSNALKLEHGTFYSHLYNISLFFLKT